VTAPHERDLSVEEQQATAAPPPQDATDDAQTPEQGHPADQAGTLSPEPGPDAEPAPEPEPEVDEFTQAQTALAERTLDLQRLQAEYLNYKRRVERDRDLVRQNAVFAALTNLLPVLDDIDRAREHGELEGGFKAVADALERIVSGLGLTKFGVRGDEFDPNLHEALMHGHSPEVTTTTVDVVAHAGYRIGDRVVRAAKVTVLDPEG
jgi:molecular chaperone GrpE